MAVVRVERFVSERPIAAGGVRRLKDVVALGLAFVVVEAGPVQDIVNPDGSGALTFVIVVGLASVIGRIIE